MDGFWIFMSALLVSDAWLFSKGWNTFFFGAKTPEEKRLREALIKIEENKAKKI